MRHLLFALLIALLPLRGWVGDAMATQMAAGQLQHQAMQASPQAAAHDHEAMDAGHAAHEDAAPDAALALHDCADSPTDGAGHPTDGHCDTCAACQACHTVALSLPAPAPVPVFSAPTLPRPAADMFASADAALRQKPPIS